MHLLLKFGFLYAEKILNFNAKTITVGNSIYNVKFSQFYNELKKQLHCPTENTIDFTCYSHFSRCGTIYKKGFVVFFYDPNMRAYKIKEIYVFNETIYFLANELNIELYDRNYLSYMVADKPLDFQIQMASSIKSPPVQLHIINNRNYLRPKSLY